MELLRKPVTVVWAVLMLATVASTWWLSKDVVSPVVGTVAIMVIAGFKVRLVMWHFMELRDAPVAWRCVQGAWVFLVTAMIAGIYLA